MTQVESFLIEEVKELIFDSDKTEEWKEKVSQLNLEGQKKLLNPDKPDASPIPFAFMNKIMKVTYGILCPVKDSVLTYDKTAIPLQVLSLIALCNQEGYFQKIQIWSDNDTPDPIAVGYTDSSNSYVIARWGDELRSFPELIKLAKEKQLQTLKIELQKVKSKIESTDPEAVVEEIFNGGYYSLQSIFISY